MLNETVEKLNNQAILLASQGDYNEAIACFIRALTIENDNSLLWFNLALTYRDTGKFQSARNALEKAYDIDYTDESIIEELALVCFQLGDFDVAATYCEVGLEANSENAHLWNTLGVIHFNTKNYNKASHAFENAISINPYYYDALYNLRDTYNELGNKKGEEECRRCLKELEKNGDVK